MLHLLSTTHIRSWNRLARLAVALVVILLAGCGQPDPLTTNPQAAASTSTPTATPNVTDLGLMTPVPSSEDLTAIAIKQADLQAEQNMQATAAARPTAPPDRQLPTYAPQPTPALRMGVYESLDCTSDGFYTVDDVEFGVYNCWFTVLNGQRVRVDAGGDMGNSARGGLIVYTNTLDLRQPISSPVYWTPTNVGVIHIVQINGTQLTVQSDNGTTLVFDLTTRTWATSSPFPTATPTSSGVVDTIVVRHAPSINGTVRIEGTLRQLQGEALTLNGGAVVTGDLILPGSPNVTQNGSPVIGASVTGTGSAQPSGYRVIVNGSVQLGRLVTRTDPIAMSAVAAPPAPTGTRDVVITRRNGNTRLRGVIHADRLTLSGGATVQQIGAS